MKNETFMVKPMSPTKAAGLQNLFKKMEEFFKEIESLEKKGEIEKGMVLLLVAVREIFSERINDFQSLEIDDKLLLLAQSSFKAGILCMNILKKSLAKEVTQDIYEILQRSGLIKK